MTVFLQIVTTLLLASQLEVMVLSFSFFLMVFHKLNFQYSSLSVHKFSKKVLNNYHI